MAVRFVDADTLSSWVHEGQKVNVVDIRPASQRNDWFIPGSIHKDVYDRIKSGDSKSLSDLHLDKSTPTVIVCSAGKVSQLAAEMLVNQGYNAFSLVNGMRGWSFAWNTAVENFDLFTVLQVRRIGKGCLSYVLSSGREAFVIDASLPVDVYSKLIETHGLQLTAVIDTHIHADHLSRSQKLANFYSVPLYLPENSAVRFSYSPMKPNDELPLGEISLKILNTPGHTLESVSLLAGDKALFTGDTLFTDSIGRPDLKSNDEQLKLKSGLLYESLRRLLSLPGDIRIFPSHTAGNIGFSDNIIAANIKEIQQKISIVQLPKQQFAEAVAQKIPPTPENYQQIVERNIIGEFDETEAPDMETGANRCSI